MSLFNILNSNNFFKNPHKNGGSIGPLDIQDRAVHTAALNLKAVTTDILDDNSVSSDKLQINSVTPDKLLPWVVYNIGGIKSTANETSQLYIEGNTTNIYAKNTLHLGASVITVRSTNGIYTYGLVQKSEISPAISVATTLTVRDSGGVFTLDDGGGGGGLNVTLPTPQQGLTYDFVVTGAGSVFDFVVTGNTIYGNLIRNNTFTALNASGTIGFSATSAIGDTIHFKGVDSLHWLVEGVSFDANGIS